MIAANWGKGPMPPAERLNSIMMVRVGLLRAKSLKQAKVGRYRGNTLITTRTGNLRGVMVHVSTPKIMFGETMMVQAGLRLRFAGGRRHGRSEMAWKHQPEMPCSRPHSANTIPLEIWCE